MIPNSTDSFDPNQYYRIINLALGPELSLDVDNGDPVNGSLSLTSTGPFSGQIWQFLQTDDAKGHFYISCQFLGPKLKLDILPNERGDFVPHLRNFTQYYNQTWSLTPHVDVLDGNRATWTMTPDFIRTGVSGSDGVISVYNDTLKPYMAPSATDDKFQRWSVVMEGDAIDDPAFSATNLQDLPTQTPPVPVVLPTGLPTTTASPTSSPSAATSSPAASGPGYSNDQLTSPLIAAAVVPTTVVALAIAAFCLFIFMRRRRLRQLDENSPYPSPRQFECRGGGSVDKMTSTGVVSEFVDSFVESPMERWKRENAAAEKKQQQASGPGPGGLAAASLVSSNLSASLWSFRNPQDSTASVTVNPLRPPPLTRLYSGESDNNVDDGFAPAPLASPRTKIGISKGSFLEIEGPPSPEIPLAKRSSDRSLRDGRRGTKTVRTSASVDDLRMNKSHGRDSPIWI